MTVWARVSMWASRARAVSEGGPKSLSTSSGWRREMAPQTKISDPFLFPLFATILPGSLTSPLMEWNPCWSRYDRRVKPFGGRGLRVHGDSSCRPSVLFFLPLLLLSLVFRLIPRNCVNRQQPFEETDRRTTTATTLGLSHFPFWAQWYTR